MRMPFGKYRDVHISKVPTEYLEWMAENVTFKSEGLKEAVECEILDRAERNKVLEEDFSGPSFDPDDDIPL